VPVEFTGYEKRKKCPKGTSWNKGSSSCQSNFSILGDPLGALKETIEPKSKSKSKTKTMSNTKQSSKTKSPIKTNFSNKKKSSSKLKKSNFIGLDDFYSSSVDLGKKMGLNDFLDTSFTKSKTKSKSKSKSKPKSKTKSKSKSKSKSKTWNTAELADRQAFLDEENYSPKWNTEEIADRDAFLNEDKPKKTSVVKKSTNNNEVKFFGTQRIVTTK
jgi:hypothetical protein